MNELTAPAPHTAETRRCNGEQELGMNFWFPQTGLGQSLVLTLVESTKDVTFFFNADVVYIQLLAGCLFLIPQVSLSCMQNLPQQHSQCFCSVAPELRL